MQKYTIGQVIDEMKIGEVAVRASGGYTEETIPTGYSLLEVGLFFDENDNNMLKSLDGYSRISIAKVGLDMIDYFYIIDRRVYNKIVEKGGN